MDCSKRQSAEETSVVKTKKPCLEKSFQVKVKVKETVTTHIYIRQAFKRRWDLKPTQRSTGTII